MRVSGDASLLQLNLDLGLYDTGMLFVMTELP